MVLCSAAGGWRKKSVGRAVIAEGKVDVAIIGAGTAGLAAYRRVCEHTDRLVLIEVGPHGTTRVGCMPSKLLIAAEAATRVAMEPTT